MPSTPAVSYAYGTSSASNNNGRLITMTDGPGQESYTYDSLGRMTQVQKKVYNVRYTTGSTYNLAGEVATVTYPSGRVVKDEYDAIGRLQNVKNNTTSANYATSATYNAASQVTGFSYGNSVTASFGYSAQRLQLTSLSYTKDATTHLNLSYGYSQSGANNRQIASITDNTQAGRTANYTYDSLHRVKTAVTTGSAGYPQWGLSWVYDRWGNRKEQNRTHGTTAPTNAVTVSTSTNRITQMGSFTFSYDLNGNLTQDDLYKYKYDAENRMIELRLVNDALVATYAFDGNSLRVIKVVGADRTWYLYAGSQVVSEFEDAASNTYAPGTLPGAMSDGGATQLYQHADHLTTRLTTDNSGQLSNEQAHYPYGENWYNAGTADPSVLRKFTSYEKDAEASAGQLHYAIFREHGARIGRFHMPDPLQETLNPQGFNRYAYVGNEPISRVDPKGLWAIGSCGIWEQIHFGTLCGEGGGGGVWSEDSGIGRSAPGMGGGISFISFVILPILCPGTTGCSYYDGQCKEAKRRLPLYLLCGPLCAGDIPGAIVYYCVAAPRVCRGAGNTPYQNCIRLCLQRFDDCLGKIAFVGCQVSLHEQCFIGCTPCLLR